MSAPLTSQTLEALLEAAVAEAAHHLPAQGPIGRFVHHNTLHAFQHLPFEEAVVEAHRVFGAEPFMALRWYHARRDEGRIDEDDVSAVLARQVGPEPICEGGPGRRDLRRQLMEIATAELDDELVRYRLAESDELGEPAALALWTAAERFVDEQELAQVRRFRGPDQAEDHVNAALQRLAGAFLDQGMAYWPMPDRNQGFYLAVRGLLAQRGHFDPAGLRGLGRAFREQATAEETAMGVVLRHLAARGVEPRDWPAFVEHTLLKMPGWSGILHVLEEDPAVAPHAAPPCSLVDWLAVRLTLETCAEPSAEVEASSGRLVAAFEICELAKAVGWTASDLAAMTTEARRALASEIREVDDLERRCLWQLAYERHHRNGVLGAMAAFRDEVDPNEPRPPPRAQVFFCIDDREESIRRHLEELDPGWETYGAAGFFGVAIQYRGHDDAHGTALCPVAVRPQHLVAERAVAHDRAKSERRAARRRLAASFGRGAWVGSRGLVRGWLATAGLGLLSAVPLSGRVILPGTFAKLEKSLAEAFLPTPRTELNVSRGDDARDGFTLEEKVERVAGILVSAGLIDGFAPLVAIIGHGSSSLNNPHEAAHDCGACGGGRGGPNARLFSTIANEQAVRAALRQEHGIAIPEGTWFVGGYHDTCNDAIVYYDLEEVPTALRPQLDELIEALDEARARNAHERCRLFDWSPRQGTAREALAHVEARSEHLAEPRPEYGHATNALCIVGRRALTRGLFLDRRAFLVSYDPTQDDEGRVLGPLLASMGPVGAGINLEYYFSFVDNEGYGCGTKLPHNISGLLGVMNGHASDLRTGLPWQMVEVHEPVRLVTIVESTPETLLAIAERHPAVGELIVNRWIQLVSVDPVSGEMHVYDDGRFQRFRERVELPVRQRSYDFYVGETDHLPVARIHSGMASSQRRKSSS